MKMFYSVYKSMASKVLKYKKSKVTFPLISILFMFEKVWKMLFFRRILWLGFNVGGACLPQFLKICKKTLCKKLGIENFPPCYTKVWHLKFSNIEKWKYFFLFFRFYSCLKNVVFYKNFVTRIQRRCAFLP